MNHPDQNTGFPDRMKGDFQVSFEKLKSFIKNEFRSTHRLDFYTCPFEFDSSVMRYKIGTCEGIYGSTKDTYDIIAVVNNVSGNGHFEDVIEWFTNSCKRDKRSLRFVEIMNDRLRKHLVEKRGFAPDGNRNVIKHFDESIKALSNSLNRNKK